MANMSIGNGGPQARFSPRSSVEASQHGTPSTNLTAFSPETAAPSTDTRSKVHEFTIYLENPDGNTMNVGSNIGTSSTDPFLNDPTPTSARHALSPTADVFRPGHGVTSSYTSSSAATHGSSHTIVGGIPITHGRVSSLVATSIPEGPAYFRAPEQTAFGAVGDASFRVNNVADDLSRMTMGFRFNDILPFRDAMYDQGTFTTDTTTHPSARGFVITNIPSITLFASIANEFSHASYPSITGIDAKNLNSKGVVRVSFTDLRDSEKAFSTIQVRHATWRLARLSPKALSSSNDVALVSNFEGQVLVSVYFDGRDSSIQAHASYNALMETLGTFGNIKAFRSVRCQEQGNLREIRVEYYNSRNADLACRSLQKILVGPLMICVDPYTPDIGHPVQGITSPTMQPSYTGRSTVPINDPAGLYGYPPQFLSVPGNGYVRGRFDSGGNHNQVDIQRIQHGADIMLRNIPNKIDQGTLKNILDETSFGQYDFMYLRIDFANNCNVGYAFVNFVDALAIIPFTLARAGQRWNRFNSDKVAEISYATIQGKDCLVQKFRNSSVMLEHPTFRPKLFVTGSGSDAGDEEHFPGPDNPSKMRRSVENAEHVGLFSSSTRSSRKKARRAATAHTRYDDALMPASGLRSSTTTRVDRSSRPGPFFAIADQPSTRLFAPRQGQVYREEQRRRRSQFDRGTPGAEYEAYNQGLSNQAFPTHPAQATSSSHASLHFAQAMPGPNTYRFSNF